EEGRPLVGPEEGGDEAVLLARRFAGPVVSGERRAEAAAVACARFALDALVLDDGFQHRALARDADLVLVSEETARAWPLPAGPRRPRRHHGEGPREARPHPDPRRPRGRAGRARGGRRRAPGRPAGEAVSEEALPGTSVRSRGEEHGYVYVLGA